MPSRRASLRSVMSGGEGLDALIGTYQADGAYVAVKVAQPAMFSMALVFVERQRIPGAVFGTQLISRHRLAVQAVRAARGHVLANGGALETTPEALSGSPVDRGTGRQMFTELGLQRFVHVPTPEG